MESWYGNLFPWKQYLDFSVIDGIASASVDSDLIKLSGFGVVGREFVTMLALRERRNTQNKLEMDIARKVVGFLEYKLIPVRSRGEYRF